MHSAVVFFSVLVVWLFVSSFFEWVLHRYVMHRPVGAFVYPFKAHALVHHRIFRADSSYHLKKPADKDTIPMAWWNGPVLALIAAIPALPFVSFFEDWTIYWGAVCGTGLYYCVYEYIHWCMHLPKARRVERSALFRRLNAHHLLHHRYMHKNFNVVMPLADVLLGTYLPRARTRFAQPNNPAVPDVQPLGAESFDSARG